MVGYQFHWCWTKILNVWLGKLGVLHNIDHLNQRLKKGASTGCIRFFLFRILERGYHFVEGTEKDEILYNVVNNFTLHNPQQPASYGLCPRHLLIIWLFKIIIRRQWLQPPARVKAIFTTPGSPIRILMWIQQSPWVNNQSIQNSIGPNQRTPKRVARDIRYSGLGKSADRWRFLGAEDRA